MDLDNDDKISFAEYRMALLKNPDILDWFEILNNAKDHVPSAS